LQKVLVLINLVGLLFAIIFYKVFAIGIGNRPLQLSCWNVTDWDGTAARQAVSTLANIFIGWQWNSTVIMLEYIENQGC